MLIIGHRKRKKVLLKNSKNLKAIHDEYYELAVFNNVVFDRTYVVERFKHTTADIMDRYGINSIHELLFLIHRHCGKVVRDCQFCGHQVTEIKTRTGILPNRDDCECKGICTVCDKPYVNANDDGVCYSCKPYYDQPMEAREDTEADMRYRFMQCVCDHTNVINIEDPEEIEKMMSVAQGYYNWFESIHRDMMESEDNE